MSYFNLVEEFLLEKEINNCSKSTITYYERALERFGDFLGEKNLEQSIVNQYKHYLMNLLNPISVNHYLRAVRTFVNYYNLPIVVKLVKEDEVKKEPYTEYELKLLLKKPSVKNFTVYKTWTMINTFISTGIRLSSCLDLKISDVDLESAVLAIRNHKSRKPQLIPISKQLEIVLREYLKRRKGEPEDYLFCNTLGKKMDNRTVQKQIQRFNQSRGVNKSSVHLFRHTFATMYLKNGGDIYRLQKILGHSSIKVTEKYLHYTCEDLSDSFSRLNPLDNITYRVK